MTSIPGFAQAKSKPSAAGVVIVNYNAGDWLVQSVKTALQSSDVCELVIVDNHSSDRSLTSLSEEVTDSRCRIVRLERNFGFGHAVNVGVATLSSEYILLLNPDCLLRPSTVSALVAALDRDDEVAACGPVVLDISGREQRGSRRNEPTPIRAVARTFGRSAGAGGGAGFDLHKTELPAQTVAVDALSGSCMMIRKSKFDAIGRMDTQYFLHCEDLDLCRRIRDADGQIMFVPTASVIHVQGGSGRNLKVEWYKHRSMLLYHDKHAAANTRWYLTLLLKLGVWLRFALVAAPRSLLGGLSRRRFCDTERTLGLLNPFDQGALVADCGCYEIATAMTRKMLDAGSDVLLVSNRSDSKVTDRSVHSTDSYPTVNHEYLDKISPFEFGTASVLFGFMPLSKLQSESDYLFDRCQRLSIRQVVLIGMPDTGGTGISIDDVQHRQLEDTVLDAALTGKIDLTILYPATVYGDARVSELDRLCRLVKRISVLPLFGKDEATRQPLHIDDLLSSCLTAARQATATGRSYELGGSEQLPVSELLERIAATRKPPARFVRFPRLPGSLLQVCRRIFMQPENGVWNLLMPDSRNIVRDNSAASRDLGFKPKRFEIN